MWTAFCFSLPFPSSRSHSPTFPRHRLTTQPLVLTNNSVKDSIRELLQKYSLGYEGYLMEKNLKSNGDGEKGAG